MTNKKYVKINYSDNSIMLDLPDDKKKYNNAVLQELSTEFAYEPISEETIENMNNFVIKLLNELSEGVNQ